MKLFSFVVWERNEVSMENIQYYKYLIKWFCVLRNGFQHHTVV